MRSLVYSDKGVGALSLRQIYQTLKKETHWQLSRIKAGAILNENVLEQADCLVMPGGADIGYHRLLQGKGCQKIRAFVEKGGVYLGICAGAYFGASKIHFTHSDGSIIDQERELKFFPGLAKGPAFGEGLFNYNNEQGASLQKVLWGEETYYSYFNGGCVFEASGKGFEVLARFETGELAIVKMQVGEGLVVLVAPHVEYRSALLDDTDPYSQKIKPLLEKRESQAKALFTKIVEEVQDHIEVKNRGSHVV